MAKLIISDRNYIPDATLAGGSYEATLPLSNAQERPFSKVARTTDATSSSTFFTVDIGTIQQTQLLSLINHNIKQVSATIRFRASNDAGATTNLLYDSGTIVALPSVYDWLSHDFYEDNWFYGEPYADDLALYTKQLIHVTPSPVRARYWRVDIADSSNADGYIQFGYFYSAPISRGTVDVTLGSSLTFADNTGVQEAISGVEYYDNRSKPRFMTIGYRGLGKDEMLSGMFNTTYRRAKSGMIYIIPDDTDNLNINKEAFLGRIAQEPAFSDFSFGFYETSISLKEIV